MLRRHGTKALVALAATAPIFEAAALWGDHISPFVGEVVTRDDNVFRLQDGVDPQTVLGAPSGEDTYHVTSAGIGFDVKGDTQRFDGEIALNRYRFRRFEELDFNGYGARATWHWRAGERFNGDVGHDRSQQLASLSNVQSGTRSTTPNIISTQRSFVTATFQPTSHWEVRGQLRVASQQNEAVRYKLNDLDAHSTELSLAYVTTRLARIGVLTQNVDGRLPNPEPVGPLLVNNSYDQHTVGAFVEWQPSAHSQFKLRAGSTDRNYAALPRRDFSGSTHIGTFEWQPTDNLTLTAISQRDISATEEINVGLVLADGIGLYTRWNVRENATLALELERADRTYLGDAVAFLSSFPPYAERVHSAGARLSLHPRKPFTVDIGWKHERRSVLNSLGSYGVGIATVGFRFAF